MDSLPDENVFVHLKVFTEFVCEEKPHSIEDVINASIILLRSCPACRTAVFKFYKQLFDEYCYEYCVFNLNDSTIPAELLQTSSLLKRFVQSHNKPEISSSKKAEDVQEKTESKPVEDCPQSPPKEICEDYEMEDLSSNLSLSNNMAVLISLLDRNMTKLEEILNYMIHNDSDGVFASPIFDWSLDLATEISKKYHRFVVADSSQKEVYMENKLLMNSLKFWVNCPAMQILIKIIFDCLEKTDAKTLINRLMKSSPNSDWIMAHLFTSLSQSKYLTQYIEQLINNSSAYSTIFILSYVSEHNPHAIVKCSKSNLQFLLKLCTNSKPLLDLLATDIVKQVNIKSLNKFAESNTSDEVNQNILYCILNAPNAFELLKTSFDLVINPNSSEVLCDRILTIMWMVLSTLHSFVFDSFEPNCNKDAYSIITLLRNNVKQLISHPAVLKNNSLKKIQLKLLNLTCTFYGVSFITEVFHHLLNSSHTIDFSNYESSKSSPLLFPLLNSLKLHIGYKIYDCIKGTLRLNFPKKLSFWAVLLSSIESKPLQLDINDLIDHLKTISLDYNESIIKYFYILKIIENNFEKNPKQYHCQQYKLCMTLVIVYFDLIQLVNNEKMNGQQLTTITQSIVITQKLLSNFSLKYYINEYVVCKNLIEMILDKRKLFSEEYLQENNEYTFSSICLMNQNLLVSDNSIKLKNSLLPPSKKRKVCRTDNLCFVLNKQLVLDLLQTCVKDRQLFTKMFVDSVTNETVFYNAPWLDEDLKDSQVQHIRMTLESDLYISKLFEEDPILWNIFEIISSWKCLKHAMVIIRALINVQRTNLISSTMNSKNVLFTQKIISLIANSEVLPCKPFIYIKELVPKISNLDNCYILHDIAKFIRNNSIQDQSKNPIKPYLERLRIIMAYNEPNELYIKIFKSI